MQAFHSLDTQKQNANPECSSTEHLARMRSTHQKRCRGGSNLGNYQEVQDHRYVWMLSIIDTFWYRYPTLLNHHGDGVIPQVP
jgi:hypothetical protein